MNNDLILYWSNAACYEIDGKDWTFLYQKPTILYDELFNRHVENGRYELTFEHLKEVNPKLGKEMEEWMNHETE